MVQVEWANPEENILRWHVCWPWSWAEFYAAAGDCNRMIDAMSGMADSIILTSGQPIMPMHALSKLPQIFKARHPRQGLIVLVGSGSFTMELVKLSSQFIPDVASQLRYAPSEDEALALIRLAQAQRNNGPA